MNRELKPCPFCGCTAEYDKEDDIDYRGNPYISHYVWCPYHKGGCGARIYGSSKREVINLWNNRVSGV